VEAEAEAETVLPQCYYYLIVFVVVVMPLLLMEESSNKIPVKHDDEARGAE